VRFYDAVQQRDLKAARAFLDPQLTFFGLFETYRSADEDLTALTGLLSITTRLEVKTIVAEGENAAIFFDLTTAAPAAAKTLVAEWHVVHNGRIVQVRSAFDGRRFAGMFGAPATLPDPSVSAADGDADEQAIRALKDVFVRALLTGDARLRASLWSEDGTVVPPQGGFFMGHEAITRHFATEAASLTTSSTATFGHYRMRFITSDIALVDTVLTLTDVAGADGSTKASVHVAIVFTAIKQHGAWHIQDERAHFTAAAMPSSSITVEPLADPSRGDRHGGR
jgi:uncharacterized protein (TIGR02246 family)